MYVCPIWNVQSNSKCIVKYGMYSQWPRTLYYKLLTDRVKCRNLYPYNGCVSLYRLTGDVQAARVPFLISFTTQEIVRLSTPLFKLHALRKKSSCVNVSTNKTSHQSFLRLVYGRSSVIAVVQIHFITYLCFLINVYYLLYINNNKKIKINIYVSH